MPNKAKHYFDFGDFRVDLVERTLQRQGKAVPLTPKAFDTLLVLVENSKQLVGKEELFQRVWPDTYVSEVTLARNISTLRQALGNRADGQPYIETVPRRGYRFIVEVREVRDADAGLMRHEAVAEIADPGPAGKGLPIVIERHSVSQVITEREEADDAPDAEAAGLLVGETARKPHWLKSQWGAATLAVLLTACVTVPVVYVWTARRARPAVTVSSIRTLAVLPLKIINAERGDEYLGIGIADRLIDDLSKLPQVVIRPTDAVLKYVGEENDALKAGQELNVEAVLVGSVQMTGERMRTTLQLVRVSDGAALWVKNLEGSFAGIFALQEEIAGYVSQALRFELREDQRRQIANRGTASTVAYNAYMRGRFFWAKRTREGIGKAIEQFQQAVNLDPNYPHAYTGLADCYALSELLPSPISQSYPKAKSAALKALQLDDSLAEAHNSLAWIKFFYEWDWSGAEREFKRALELDPNSAHAHQWYGNYLVYLRRFDEALVEMRRAQELDPTSLIINTSIGVFLFRAGREDDAIRQLRQTLDMDPNFSRTHLFLAVVYQARGRYQEALAEMQKASLLAKDDPFQMAQLASIYATSGRRKEALKLINTLKVLDQRQPVLAGAIGAVYADLQENEQALAWLDEAYKRHEMQLFEVNLDHHWDGLRADARFKRVMQQVGLQ